MRRFVAIVMLAFAGCATGPRVSPAVPFEIEAADFESTRIYVPCEFDDIHERCLLDTGATYTSVHYSPGSAAFPIIGFRRTMSAAGKIRDEEKIHIERFSLGPIYRTHFEVARYRDKQNQATRLGIDLLQRTRLTFNFDTHTLQHCSRRMQTGEPLWLGDNGLAYVYLEVGGHGEWAIWDTGAEITAIDRTLVASEPNLFEFVENIVTGSDAMGAKVPVSLYRTSAIEVDGHPLSGNVLAMDFAPLRANLKPGARVILGANLLRQINWDFDFKRRLFRADLTQVCN